LKYQTLTNVPKLALRHSLFYKDDLEYPKTKNTFPAFNAKKVFDFFCWL